MEEKEIDLEEVSFKIISFSGEARSCALEAIREMRINNDLQKTCELLKRSEEMMIEAERQHMDLVVDEARGIKRIPTILLLHAEDQLLTTQTLIQLTNEIIEMYKIINSLKGDNK